MLKRIIFLLIVLLLAGCSQNTAETKFNYPENTTMTEHTVEHGSGHDMRVVKINHSSDYDLYEKWEERNQAREMEAKYDANRNFYDNKDEFIEQEENDLKDYCDSLHSNSCRDMEYLEYRDGCREVDISCEKEDSQGVCLDYDVRVKWELVDC